MANASAHAGAEAHSMTLRRGAYALGSERNPGRHDVQADSVCMYSLVSLLVLYVCMYCVCACVGLLELDKQYQKCGRER